MNRNKFIPLFIIILLFVIAGCAKDKSNGSDEVVAKVGENYTITANELNQYVHEWHFTRRYRDRSEAYTNALNILLFNRLKVLDFFDRKLNENKELMQEISRFVNYELINTYFNKEFINKYADRKNAEKAYKEMGKIVTYEEIILPIPPDESKEKLDSMKTIALNIEEGLSKNYDIRELARLDSLKNIIINDRKKMEWSQSILDPVGNVVFGLQQGFTRVIMSYDGFHIVKVLDIQKIQLEPFEKMKDKIISQLKKGYYQASNDEFDNFRSGIINKSSLKWNQRGLDQLVKWSSEDPYFYGGAYKDVIQNAISKGNDFEILSYDKGNVDLKEYLRLLEEIVILNRNIVLKPDNVKDFIINAVADDDVAKAAKEAGLEKELINPNTKDPIIQSKIIYLYNKAVIDGSIPAATPEALHKFYEDQKDSTFYQLKIVYVFARVYSDSAKAAADINAIRKGTPFEKVKDAWLVKMFIRYRDGSLKAYRTAGGDYLAKAAFALKLNQCAGPIEYNDSTKGKQFAVIKCFKIIPEKQLTYDDVKGKRIEDEYDKYYRNKISDEIYEKLKKKYNAKIFPDVLSEAIAVKEK